MDDGTITALAYFGGLAAIIFLIWYFLLRTHPSQADERVGGDEPVGRYSASDSLTGPQSVDLLYADADGVITRRDVTVMAVEIHPETRVVMMFEGWCHLRRDRRRFRPDRILEMRDVSTGRELHPQVWLTRWAEDNGLR